MKLVRLQRPNEALTMTTTTTMMMRKLLKTRTRRTKPKTKDPLRRIFSLHSKLNWNKSTVSWLREKCTTALDQPLLRKIQVKNRWPRRRKDDYEEVGPDIVRHSVPFFTLRGLFFSTKLVYPPSNNIYCNRKLIISFTFSKFPTWIRMPKFAIFCWFNIGVNSVDVQFIENFTNTAAPLRY